jgi:hypothetical protein
MWASKAELDTRSENFFDRIGIPAVLLWGYAGVLVWFHFTHARPTKSRYSGRKRDGAAAAWRYCGQLCARFTDGLQRIG